MNRSYYYNYTDGNISSIKIELRVVPSLGIYSKGALHKMEALLG